MTAPKIQPPVEENFYQLLEVTNTASLATIRNAYEKKLEETHIESFASYTLIPEEETEVLLLQFSQAFVTLANPIARAKYDDELNQQTISAETQPAKGKDSLQKVKQIYSPRPKWSEKKGRWGSWAKARWVVCLGAMAPTVLPQVLEFDSRYCPQSNPVNSIKR